MKLLVIYNPGAACGRAAKALADIRVHFGNLGIATTFLSTARPGDGARLVAGADLADYDGVVAAGGDGTVSEVLNGLWSQPPCRRVPLGVLPVGTGN
ncbi:MAG: acylglycerol kinase family protein, partial [Lysobacterales bacterium]